MAVDAEAPDMTAALREANGGARVDVVLDMTGGRITDESIAALAPFGRLAFYGMANRQPPQPVAPASLLAHSTTVAGMWLVHAARVPGLLSGALSDLFAMVEAGTLRVVSGGDVPTRRGAPGARGPAGPPVGGQARPRSHPLITLAATGQALGRAPLPGPSSDATHAATSARRAAPSLVRMCST